MLCGELAHTWPAASSMGTHAPVSSDVNGNCTTAMTLRSGSRYKSPNRTRCQTIAAKDGAKICSSQNNRNLDESETQGKLGDVSLRFSGVERGNIKQGNITPLRVQALSRPVSRAAPLSGVGGIPAVQKFWYPLLTI